jgi:tetratricopeptide (TPR) repeat protein
MPHGRRIIAVICLLLFAGLEWLVMSRSAGLLTQRRAFFLSKGREDTYNLLVTARKYDPHNGPTRLNLAGLMMTKKMYLEAQMETQNALRYFASLDSYNQLASIELNLGNPKRANDLYARIIRSYPGDEDARLRHAAVNIALDDYDAAYRDIDTLLRVHPDNLTAYYYLGLILSSENKAIEALSIFVRLNLIQSEPDPKLFYTPDNLYYEMAKAEISLQNWDAAGDYLKKGLARKKSAPYINALSFVYKNKGDFKKAEEILTDGLKSFPDAPELKSSLATLQKIGHSEERMK